ncbi:peptidase S24/S26A/S26B/S26C [Lipomyces japonicus]|uniref:peptidase S24/S26A/S26B/S26C n=1 Tax=Lipomyces japonicus TaxID=56871 RepID=UPI0034CD9634
MASFTARRFDYRKFTWMFSIFIRGVAGFHLLQSYVYEFALTGGLSMMPTINLFGDNVFVDKLNYRYGRNAKIGDVVVAIKPTEDNVRICKRIAGLPGDIIFCNRPSSYTPEGDDAVVNQRTGQYFQVPEGHVWLLGDNLFASADSREYGPIPMALILGQVKFAIHWAPFELLPKWPRKIGSNATITNKSPDRFIEQR